MPFYFSLGYGLLSMIVFLILKLNPKSSCLILFLLSAQSSQTFVIYIGQQDKEQHYNKDELYMHV